MRGAERKRDKREWEEMRATNTLTGQLEDGKHRRLKKKSCREHAANKPEPVLGTGQAKSCGGCLHYLGSGKRAPAPKPCPHILTLC